MTLVTWIRDELIELFFFTFSPINRITSRPSDTAAQGTCNGGVRWFKKITKKQELQKLDNNGVLQYFHFECLISFHEFVTLDDTKH